MTDDDARRHTRRRYVAAAGTAALAATTGCADLFGGSSDEPGTNTGDGSGPLRVTSTARVDDGSGQTVRVGVTVENTGDAARRGTLVVALSHTEAEGSIEESRPLLLAAGATRTVALSYRPTFFGERGAAGRPETGEFRFDPRFEDVVVVENYPGLPTVGERSAIDGGRAWTTAAYDAAATAYNPGTSAPPSEPVDAWAVDAVAFAFDDTGPVVRGGTVYAGRSVRALSTDDGSERWVHGEPARTGTLAVGDDAVAFATANDLRAVETDDGSVRWTVPTPGNIWQGGATIADGRVYSADGTLYAVDVGSGETAWTASPDGSLLGPPPAGGDVVLAGGDPLRAYDAASGDERWAADVDESVAAAAVAHDTAFAVTSSRLVALDLAEGRTRWFAPGPFHDERVAVGGGRVYAQSGTDRRTVALDAETGDLEWVADGTGGVLGPPSGSDGVLVVANEDGTLYGVDTTSGDVSWTLSVNANVPGAVAVADGTVYFNEPRGPLRALRAG